MERLNVSIFALLAFLLIATVPCLSSDLTTHDLVDSDPPDHGKFDTVLKQYVSQTGRVDYRALLAERSGLQEYLAILKSHPPQSDWSRKEAMAFWINTYNAFTIQLILSNYPVQSIKDIADGNPWDMQWIEIGQKTYSLNNIEHDILRTQFGDPRIHFAVNCAATSCPPLDNQAFTSKGLEAQLERLTRSFINNEKYNRLTNRPVEVSRIFDWYKKDFGDLRDFLNKYAKQPIAEDASIEFLPYDWSLNNT